MGVEEDKTGKGKGEAGNDTTVAKASVVVSFAKERTAEELEGERKQWQAATLALLQELKIDASDQTWVTAIDTASEEFQELSQKSRGQRKQEALKWIANNPRSNLSTEAASQLLALCAVKLTAREAEKLKKWTETSAPAEPVPPAPEPAAETGKTPEELAAERETWKKQVQDFFDSVGLKGSHLINLSKDNQDSAILSLQKKDPQARQQLLTEAEAWLAQPLDVLRIDLNESHQQQALAVLVIETTSLTQAQRAQLNKLRVALLVAQDPTSSLLINQLDRIHSANKKAIVEALRVQLTEDEPSDGLMRDICQVLSTLAIKDSGGAAGVPAVDALQSLEKTHWGVIVQYLEQITTGAARTDTAAQALQVIARHEDSVRWQRVVDIALDPNTQVGVRSKALEFLVENNEWDEVKTFVERARGRKELKTVVGFAQRSLEEARVAPPSEIPVTFGLGEEQSSAAPAQIDGEPATLVDETFAVPTQRLGPASLRPSEAVDSPEENPREEAVTRLTSFLIEVPEGSLSADPERARQVAEFFIYALGEEHFPSQLLLDTLEGQDFATLGMTEQKYKEFYDVLISDSDDLRNPLNLIKWRFGSKRTLGRFRELLVNEGILLSKENYQVLLEKQVGQALASFFAEGHADRARTDQVAQAVVDSMKDVFGDYKKGLIRYLRSALIYSLGFEGSQLGQKLADCWTTVQDFNQLAQRLSQLHPTGRALEFTYTESASFVDLRKALVEQGFLDSKAVAAEPLPPPGSPGPAIEAEAELDEGFDFDRVIGYLTESYSDPRDEYFSERKTADTIRPSDLAELGRAAFAGLVDDVVNLHTHITQEYEENLDLVRSTSNLIFSPDANVDDLISQMYGVIKTCLAGKKSRYHASRFQEGKTPEMGKKRFAAVIKKLHEVISSRQPAEEPAKYTLFDPKHEAETLAENIFSSDKSADGVQPGDLARIALLTYFGVVTDPNRLMFRVEEFYQSNEQDLINARNGLYDLDSPASELIKGMYGIVLKSITDERSDGSIDYEEGWSADNAYPRFEAVVTELHRILSERKSQAEPVAAAFDAAAVAQELATTVFPEGKAIANVSATDLGRVVGAAYDGVVKDTSKFSEHFVKKLEGNQSVLFLCRDMLYESGTRDATIVELLSSQLATLIVSDGFELAEGADWQTGHDRFAQVMTELHRILSERKSQAEPNSMSQLMGERYRNALAATNLDDNTKSYMDDIAKGDGSFFDQVLYEISLNAQSAEVRAHAAELLEKRKPAGRLPEEIAELAAANRAILIEHAATLLGHNMSGSEAIEGQSRWDSVYYELKAQCENRFDFTYSDEGKERLRTIVFGIFNNLDAMQNDYILRLFPEQRGERGELCAYGFDIEDEQSQRDTVEYLIEIAAINGIRFLTDLRRYYGQRFANLTYKLSSENKLSYTPNGERLLNGEASALHLVASVAGINFLAEKGLLTDELLKNADIKTIEKFIQQKRWWDALEVSAIQNQEKSEQKNRLVFTALMDEYGPDFTEEEKAAILKIDSTLLFSQIHTILDLPHAGIDDVLHYEHWQRRFESLCLSLSQACGYGQNAELPAHFNQALNNFMSRIFREEVVVQLAPAERDLKEWVVGVLKTNRLTSKIDWVQQRWGSNVDAIDKGLKFSLIRASDVAEVAEAKLAEAEMAGVEEDGDEKAPALEEIRDFGLDPSSFETETDEDRAAMWATVVDAFAELRDLPDDRVDQVVADLAIGLGALGTVGVLPPKELCDEIPYNQATDNLYKLYDQLEAGQEINPELARRALFTFWRTFWSAALPSSEAEMNSFIDEYQGTLADFLGLFAKKGYLDQQQ